MATRRAIRGGGTVDSTAFVEDSAYVAGTATVGARSYLGHGVYVEPGIDVGTDCIICDRVRVLADVPNGTTILCDCCGGDPPSGDSVLQFDSIRVVGTKLEEYVTTGKLKGTLAYVGNDTFANQNSVHDFYTLVYGEALTVDTFGTEVVNSPTFATDGAQWRRNHVVDQQAIQKVFFSVDPENVSTVASDENTGWGVSQVAADAHPLRSMGALNARLLGYKAALPLTIHLMSSPDASTYATLSSLETIEDGTNYVTIKGNLNLVNPAGENRTVTAVQAAVPATNTERTITVGGFDPAGAYTSMMVRTVDGTKTAFVTRDLGGNVLAISQPRSSDEFGTPGAVVDFAEDDQVSFFDPTRLCDWPFPNRGCPFPLLVWFRLDADGSGRSFPIGDMGNAYATIGQCILGDTTKIGVNSYNLKSTGYVQTYSVQITGQHANVIRGAGTWNNISMAVAIAGDGPQVEGGSWEFVNELNFVGIDTAPGFRQLPGSTFDVFFAGDTAQQIACFGPMSCAFDLWQPLHAPSGSFVVRPNGDGATLFKWYGIASAVPVAGLGLLTLGVGTKSQLPFSAALLTVTSTVKPIVIDSVYFDFADVPINTPSGSTLAG